MGEAWLTPERHREGLVDSGGGGLRYDDERAASVRGAARRRDGEAWMVVGGGFAVLRCGGLKRVTARRSCYLRAVVRPFRLLWAGPLHNYQR
jgi:hypothetical protein